MLMLTMGDGRAVTVAVLVTDDVRCTVAVLPAFGGPDLAVVRDPVAVAEEPSAGAREALGTGD
jgi:hypothetical protein